MWLQTRFPGKLGGFGCGLMVLLGVGASSALAQERITERSDTFLLEPPGVAAYRPAGQVGMPAGATQTTPADAPASAQGIIAEFERQKTLARIEMEEKVAQQQLKVVGELKELAARLDQTGNVREAQAVRDYMQKLVPAPVAEADPGTLVNFRDRVGQTFVFEIVGRAGSTIWGDGVYTDDSAIAVAAVHAGIVRVGEKALVQVRILPGQRSYEGATRNGVQSSTYGNWEGSYSISAYHRAVVLGPPVKAEVKAGNGSDKAGRA
jgi:hypothetical protein